MFSTLAIWLYLIGIISNIHSLALITILISILTLVARGAWYAAEIIEFNGKNYSEEYKKNYFTFKQNKFLYSAFIAGVMFSTFLPNEKTAYMMLGLTMTETAYEMNKQDVDETTKLLFDNIKKKLRDNLKVEEDKKSK